MRFHLRVFWKNLVSVFSPQYLCWHALAIVLTLTIVYVGIDWKYFVAVQYLYPYFFWTAIVGGLLPMLLSIGLLIIGYVRKSTSIIREGWLFAHAAALGWVVSSLYKVFTGRVQPNLHNYALDISHGFHFGVFRHGIFWGWPSSHTAVAFSMAFAFLYLYPEKRVASVLWIIYASLIAIGVSMSIHWLSDVVAGVLIGYVCGHVVGKSFARNLSQASSLS